jgi:hypothetical protein
MNVNKKASSKVQNFTPCTDVPMDPPRKAVPRNHPLVLEGAITFRWSPKFLEAARTDLEKNVACTGVQTSAKEAATARAKTADAAGNFMVLWCVASVLQV